jgi:hypothetical protein
MWTYLLTCTHTIGCRKIQFIDSYIFLEFVGDNKSLDQENKNSRGYLLLWHFFLSIPLQLMSQNSHESKLVSWKGPQVTPEKPQSVLEKSATAHVNYACTLEFIIPTKKSPGAQGRTSNRQKAKPTGFLGLSTRDRSISTTSQ